VEKNVQQKYRLYRRRNGRFYWQENNSRRQESLRTSDRREAQTLLNAMNESQRQPILNLSLARTYLAAHDPKMVKRTWREVMTEMATHGIPSTQERCSRAFCSRAYDPLRHKPLVQTTAGDLLAVLHANGNCVGHYLRRLHNLAVAGCRTFLHVVVQSRELALIAARPPRLFAVLDRLFCPHS
jgi:hypothetical protein